MYGTNGLTVSNSLSSKWTKLVCLASLMLGNEGIGEKRKKGIKITVTQHSFVLFQLYFDCKSQVLEILTLKFFGKDFNFYQFQEY